MAREIAIFLSDLHIGGLFDYKSFNDLKEKIQRTVYYLTHTTDAIYHIFLLGDICDYQGLYKTQISFLRGFWQAEIAAKILFDFMQIFASNHKPSLHLVPGNHDRRPEQGINLIDPLVQKLEKMMHKGLPFNICIHEEGEVVRICNKNFLIMHSVVPRSTGSYAGGITPRILTAALIMLNNRRDADIIVAGHHHVFAYTDTVLLLPSFQFSRDPKFNLRGIIIVAEDFIVPILKRQEFYKFDLFLRELLFYYAMEMFQMMTYLERKEALDEMERLYEDVKRIKMEESEEE